jgi:hypothetical protein
MVGEDGLKGRTNDLNEWLSAKKLTTMSEPIYAFYNPPWTLPFLRRSEVMTRSLLHRLINVFGSSVALAACMRCPLWVDAVDKGVERSSERRFRLLKRLATGIWR